MSSQKTAIILPNNIWFCPYVNIYTDYLTKKSIPYDIISWNRDGTNERAIQFNYTIKQRNPFVLLCAYVRFASFVKRVVKKNGYNKLIVFTPQSGIFLSRFLEKEYNNQYIFDYRDLSIEQNPLFKRSFNRLLNSSYANVISSPGFKKYLPKGFDYYLSHNFDINKVQESLDSKIDLHFDSNSIDILTIGGIRDYESNVEIINHLSNIEGFTVRFVGKGPSAASLQERAKELQSQNVSFEGYYPKEKEGDYIKQTTYLNIFYPRKPSHDTAISNRFYNALIYRKPIITTKNTTQGDFAENYNIGVAIENCDNLSAVLKQYIDTIDSNTFSNNCTDLLKAFLHDYDKWAQMLSQFFTT